MSPNIVVTGGGRDDPWASWHVARGDEAGNTCIVAGKRSIFRSVTRLVWHRSSGGRYKTKKNKRLVEAWSRILVAELVFWQPRCGMDKVRVCSVHTHRGPAARRAGFTKGADEFWRGLHHRIVKRSIDIIGGDFNMALWDVKSRLQQCGSEVTLLSAYALRQVSAISAVAEEGDGDTDSDGPPPPPPLPLRRPPIPTRATPRWFGPGGGASAASSAAVSHSTRRGGASAASSAAVSR